MQYNSVRQVSEFNTELRLKGFNVFQIESDGGSVRSYSRKDFYKICLTTGKSKIFSPLLVLSPTKIVVGQKDQPA